MFAKLKLIFTIIIIGVIYTIIFIALRIMHKDIRNGNKIVKKKKSYGLEVLNPGESSTLKKGGVIPINQNITIGRKEDNLYVLDDPYVSAHHSSIYYKNDSYVLEDLNSTNGTIHNGQKIENRINIKVGDIIKIGNTTFKVIG